VNRVDVPVKNVFMGCSMQLGRVIGTATSTVKHPTFEGERLLVVQLELANGRPDGEPLLVFDRLGAGRGDRVLCTNDGRALQEMLGFTTPGRWSVLGLPDAS
jgi:ethanolamine utilization protein EutN